MDYGRVAIVGAGAMGGGIARIFAAASSEVVLIDITQDLVDKGIKRIGASFGSEIRKGKISPEQRDAIMARITGAVGLEAASTAGLVIEAIVESQKIKSEVFAGLNRICPVETVLATNTSTLSVTSLAKSSGRPERFLGLHFFNPVHIMKLVEVIPGMETDKEVVDAAIAAMKAVKKVPVVVQDCPGFLVNRVLLPYISEALLCAEEGIAPEEIDGEAKKGGFPMGPLELSDMVGWDVTLHTLPILNGAYGERIPFPELVKKLNEAGRLGAKAGKGVYTNGKVDDEFRGMVKELAGAGSFSVDRLILRQVNEAVYCLQEGVAKAEEIDRAMVLGTGFPNEGGVGGPLHWADEKGLDWVVERLEQLAAASGSRFWPHHLLKTYIAAGRTGKKSAKGFFAY